MSDPCCNSFGGRISLEIDGVMFPPTEADITLVTANISVDAGANQDGTMYAVSKPELYGAEFKFRHPCGIKYDELLRKCSINATIVEIDNNRSHIFTGARFVGKITRNVSNGEVDGGMLKGTQYQEVAG
jgi:hypothetical protein